MSQSLAETHVENLIYECDCITAGKYGESTQEHIDDLMLQMEGFSFPLMCTRSSAIPRDKTLKGCEACKGVARGKHGHAHEQRKRRDG